MLSLACLFVSYNSMMIVVLMGEMTEDPLLREDHGEVQEIRAIEELEMIVETKTKAPGDTTGSMRVTTPKEEHSPGNALPSGRRRFQRSLGTTQTERELRRQKTRT